MFDLTWKSKSPVEFTVISLYVFYSISLVIIPICAHYGLWKAGPLLVYQQDRFADLIKVALSYRHILGDLGNSPQFLLWSQHYRDFYTNNPFLGISALNSGELTNLHLAPGGQVISLFAAIMISVGFSPTEVVRIYFFAYLVLVIIFLLKIKVLGASRRVQIVSLALLMVSWPAVFAIDRGNFSSLFVSIFIAFYILYVQLIGKQKNALLLSLLFFSFAITIRPNIAFFFLLFLLVLPVRSYLILSMKTILVSLAIGSATYLLAHSLYPDYQIHSFVRAYNNYRQIYEIGSAGDLYNNSLYFPFKFIGKVHLAFYASLLMLVLGGFLVWAYKLRFVISLFIVCLMTMLCTPIFADYHMLIFAFPIIFTLVKFPTWKDFDQIDLTCLLFSIYLVAPKNYYHIPGSTLSSFFNPVLGGLAMFYLLFSWALKEKHPGEKPC